MQAPALLRRHRREVRRRVHSWLEDVRRRVLHPLVDGRDHPNHPGRCDQRGRQERSGKRRCDGFAQGGG